MYIQTIIQELDLDISHCTPVHGGDINSAYCLTGSGKVFFLKVNEAGRYPAMFEKEARGLNALRKATVKSSLHVPATLKYGEVENQQYLVLEWISPGRPAKDFWENFGRSLAKFHQHTNDSFGWAEDNYIGSLLQENTMHENWASFYTHCRIIPLVRELFDRKIFSTKDVNHAEACCAQFGEIFPNEIPALLHGDLWSGNFMTAQDGQAVIYDPAVYYGHREMDLGMTRLFGGFEDRFYQGYHEAYPLEKNWESRLDLTQLYPLLVHAVLFGGHYVAQVRHILQRF
ncbi:MAG TPA: fructosamine kinase family protein [Chitinophagaceae bacterium]|nr:fructosamine kinase family protein [Chitinophagaceae bacterium]